MEDFVPGIEFNRGFYAEVVGPIMSAWPHSAACLGWGSHVLGYDTERSTDHGWGPRVEVFVGPGDVSAARAAVEAGLPETFASRPVRYGWDAWPERHHVYVSTLGSWLVAQLGCDPQLGMSTLDWLVTPQQKLLEVVRGAVYHDGLGALEPLRAGLAYFPDHVWRWMVACQWRRIEQEEAFVGRAAEVGDELGSQLVAARLVRELMRLHFLYARRYWPYSKWLGTAYVELPGSAALLAPLRAAIAARSYEERERALVAVYEALMAMHNESGLTPPIDATVRAYYGRPFLVAFAERIVEACRGAIDDEWLSTLPLVGSIDQFADSTDVLSIPPLARRLRAVYEQGDGTGTGT